MHRYTLDQLPLLSACLLASFAAAQLLLLLHQPADAAGLPSSTSSVSSYPYVLSCSTPCTCRSAVGRLDPTGPALGVGVHLGAVVGALTTMGVHQGTLGLTGPLGHTLEVAEARHLSPRLAGVMQVSSGRC
jgi:hypothetical protein